MKATAVFKTPLGFIGISERDGAVTQLYFVKDVQQSACSPATPLLQEAENQINEYLSGTRKEFDLPVDAGGTEFQKKVWQALRSIPYGETRSYKQVAQMINRPGAARAVGMANNKNPLLILTPCHRVLGTDGSLVGYAAGKEIKQKLLELEKIHEGG